MNQSSALTSSVDPDDVARFTAIAGEWWDPTGKFAPLHRFNPVRLTFVRDQALARFGRDARARSPFGGLKLLDIGCGGGLVSEPMRRLGFSVTAVDAGAANVQAAAAHAAATGLVIEYRCATAEALLAEGAGPFDMILNMEVVEHVADPNAYLATCTRLLAPGGLMIVATLNRTLKALALAKYAAEYVLRWLPPETHDWKKFLTPGEVRAMLEADSVTVAGPFGLAFNPLSGKWSRSDDTAINYMMTASRPA